MRSKWFKAALAALTVLAVVQLVIRIAYRERLPHDRSAFSGTDVERAQRPSAGPQQLIVLFHGMSGRPLTDVHAAVREAFPGADILMPRYSNSALSNEDPLNLVREYLATIDDAVERGDYDRIVLVGYSLGALLARKVVVCAYTGCEGDYRGVELKRAWRSKIDRLVLLAGMNRGWATHCDKVVAVQQAAGVGRESGCRADQMRWSQWVAAELGQRFAPTFGVGAMILSARKGEPFVANLRLEWLDLQQREQLPPVVQLLGDIDDVVSRSDNLDQFVTSQFVYMQLRRTTHASMVEMSGASGEERRRKFIEALTRPIEELRSRYPPPPSRDYRPDPSVQRVIMIVHGIRDDGRWATDLGREFERADPTARAFSRSYGYFSALHFLMPTRMGANVRWFVDQYTELRALYPQAQIDFVGHSNGTYMLAESLARYHAVKFRKVAFAGSVVQTGFPWSEFSDRVDAIRNYRASNDIVVAALPSVFEHVRGFLGVGGAGHAGFTDPLARRTESRYFAAGGHGAVLDRPEKYPVLVNYVLDRGGCSSTSPVCEAYELPPQFRAQKQSFVAVALYKFSVFVWLGAIFLVGLATYAAARAVRRDPAPRTARAFAVRSAAAGLGVFALILAVLRYI